MKFFGLVTMILICASSVAQIEPTDFNWVSNYGQLDSETATGVTSDIFGNVYTVGNFNGIMDADPDPNNEVLLTSTGESDLYIIKSDKNGVFIWAKQVGGDRQDFSKTVSTDASGNVYVAGYFEGTADFNPNPGESAILSNSDQWRDGFLLKLDTNGTFVWVKHLEGENSQIFADISIDDSGNMIAVGSFRNTVDFDFGPGTFIMETPGSNGFILKLDNNGDFLWAKAFVGGTVSPVALTIDSNSNIIIVGTILGGTDFDPGPGEFILSPTGQSKDAFIAKITTNGDFINAGVTGGVNTASLPNIKDIEVDSNNNIIITGFFSGEVDWDLNPTDEVYHEASGSFSIIIAKYTPGLTREWSFPVGAGFSKGNGLAIDSNDVVYVTGFSTTDPDWDPDPAAEAIYRIPYLSLNDSYVVSYNNDGTINNGIAVSGPGRQEANAIHFDKGGNLIEIGSFEFGIELIDEFDIVIGEIAEFNGFCIKYFDFPIPDPDNFPPIANNDTASLDEGDTTSIPILQNDTDDLALDENTVTIIKQPTQGTLVLNGAEVEYEHDGSNTVEDDFSYTVMDTEGAFSNVAAVTITIIPINQAPVANDDSFDVDQGENIVYDILDNDVDPDGTLDVNSVVITSAPVNGLLEVLAGGLISYTHDDSSTFSDSFNYTVMDSEGGTSNEAVVTITIIPFVNQLPIAVDDSFDVNQGENIVYDILDNDVDPDGSLDLNSVVITNAPVNGLLEVLADGLISYTHDDSNTVSDSFNYTVMDADGGTSNEALVTITIIPTINQLPIANDDSFEVDQGQNLVYDILENDLDPDGSLDLNSVVITSAPVNGLVEVLADGHISYTHDDSNTVSDSFNYTVMDTDGGTSNVAEVVITIVPRLGANDIENSKDVIVYPNPVVDILHVVSNRERPILRAWISDAIGRKTELILKMGNNNVYVANIQYLSQGMFFLELIFDDTIVIQKIVK